jgi:hypothetical protein
MKLPSRKKAAIFTAISLGLLSGILNWTYRPYIYKNDIYDFHFADTFTSWLSVPAASLLFWGIQRKEEYDFPYFIASSLIGFSAFEIFLGITFDRYDLIALYLSALITYLIYLYKNYL